MDELPRSIPEVKFTVGNDIAFGPVTDELTTTGLIAKLIGTELKFLITKVTESALPWQPVADGRQSESTPISICNGMPSNSSAPISGNIPPPLTDGIGPGRV